MAKIIIDLDSIDTATLNAIYTYSDLKQKIREREDDLDKLKHSLDYLISSTNFKYVDDKNLPSFLKINSLKSLTEWIAKNRDNDKETAESEELRSVTKRMRDVGIWHELVNIICKNFIVTHFDSNDMEETIEKIYNMVNDFNRYSDSYDPFVEFFFKNIYEILDVIEKK